MTNINLTKEQYDKLPYKTSTVTQGKTYGEIIGLLRDHGITDYQFTTIKGVDTLAFPLKVKYKDMEKDFTVKLTVPRLMYPVKIERGKYGKTSVTYLEKESWRIFWWHLKSKLEAIEYGISDEIHEFMYNITYALPNGVEMSLGDLILEKAENLDRLAQLEDHSKHNEARIIEAELVEK